MVERISREPVIVSLLKQRKPLFPNIRIFRDDVLLRAELIARRLRDPEFFADHAASTILNLLFMTVLGIGK